MPPNATGETGGRHDEVGLELRAGLKPNYPAVKPLDAAVTIDAGLR